jgi:hypothetical protein
VGQEQEQARPALEVGARLRKALVKVHHQARRLAEVDSPSALSPRTNPQRSVAVPTPVTLLIKCRQEGSRPQLLKALSRLVVHLP